MYPTKLSFSLDRSPNAHWLSSATWYGERGGNRGIEGERDNGLGLEQPTHPPVRTSPKTCDPVTTSLGSTPGYGRNLVKAEPTVDGLESQIFSQILRSPVYKFLDCLFIPRERCFNSYAFNVRFLIFLWVLQAGTLAGFPRGDIKY